MCVDRDNYLELLKRRYIHRYWQISKICNKKITLEQGTVGERKTCICMVPHDTNTCTFSQTREFEHVLVHFLY